MGANDCRTEECLLHTKPDEAGNSSNIRLPSPLVILTMVVLTCIVLLVLVCGIKHCILKCRRSIRHQDKEHQPAKQEKSPPGNGDSTAATEGGSGGLSKYSLPLSSPFWRFSSSPSGVKMPQKLVAAKYDYPKSNRKAQPEAEYQNSSVVYYTVYEEMD